MWDLELLETRLCLLLLLRILRIFTEKSKSWEKFLEQLCDENSWLFDKIIEILDEDGELTKWQNPFRILLMKWYCQQQLDKGV